MVKREKQIKNKELIDQSAERFAEILVMQLESGKENKSKHVKK